MLNVIFFTFNAFEENTYVISNEKNECWIVDPGMYHPEEVEQLAAYIAQKQWVPKGIINTHAHLDHIFGVNALKALYHIPFAIHQAELPVLNMAAATAGMFGFELADVPSADHFIKEGTPLPLGTDTLDVRFTPGHSPGSISFYYAPGNWVISGDVLFAGSIGRTDLPGGSHATLIDSIKKQLLVLPGATQVLSGHGGATTIDAEKKSNPFLG